MQTAINAERVRMNISQGRFVRLSIAILRRLGCGRLVRDQQTAARPLAAAGGRFATPRRCRSQAARAASGAAVKLLLPKPDANTR
ncbi:MAG: hypothetical protein ACK5RK_16920 [Betaproteobacteria bacterium]